MPASAGRARARSRLRLRLRWVVACVVGEALGIGVAALGFAVTDTVLAEPRDGLARLAAWLLMVGAGSVEGIVLGAATWLVVRRQVPALPARRWIGATVAVAVAGWALGMLPSTVADAQTGGSAEGPPALLAVLLILMGGLAGGALVGAAQALALRGYATRLPGWVVVNALGWAVAMLEIFAVAATGVAALGVVAGLGSGAIVGVVTATWLPLLLPTQTSTVDIKRPATAGRP